MAREGIDTKAVVGTLNEILELELAGLVHYMHYSFMIFGYNRIPVVAWMRDQAQEAMTHASQAGEWITSLGEHPSLEIGPLLETHQHDVGQILREAAAHEEKGIDLYRRLLEQVEGKAVGLEEYARAMIAEEEQHLAEIRKMLRKPGETQAAEEK